MKTYEEFLRWVDLGWAPEEIETAPTAMFRKIERFFEGLDDDEYKEWLDAGWREICDRVGYDDIVICEYGAMGF